MKKPIDRDAEDSYVLPVLTRREVRRDLRRVLAGPDPCYTIDAALKLSNWERPTLIAWSREDRFFPLEHGERLAKIIPAARFEAIEGARTFSPEDRPDRLAGLIGGFVQENLATRV
jgi:pimeloyl-ACP methyl ester carboxylesterase